MVAIRIRVVVRSSDLERFGRLLYGTPLVIADIEKRGCSICSVNGPLILQIRLGEKQMI